MGVSILVSIFKNDSNTHWQKEGWGRPSLMIKRLDINLMKGKAPRKHSMQDKTAASVLLKLFISSNE